jgi:single-stranded DNA-binding protein
MSISTLLIGSLHRAPDTKTSKSGKDYVVASVKVYNGNEAEFWTTLAFGDDTREALLTCAEGEKVALQGSPKFEANGTDDQGHLKLRRSLFVDAILTARPKPRGRKPKVETAAPEPRSGREAAEKSWAAPARAEVETPRAEKGANFDDDDIPF